VARIIQSDRYSDQRVVRVEHSEMVSDEYDVPEEWTLIVKDEGTISLGEPVATLGEASITRSTPGGCASKAAR
jgi:DNA-directed RNA polymerase subunit beta'